MVKEGFTQLEIPTTLQGEIELVKKVYTEVISCVSGLHPGIPRNQLNTMVGWIVSETLNMLTGDPDEKEE